MRSFPFRYHGQLLKISVVAVDEGWELWILEDERRLGYGGRVSVDEKRVDVLKRLAAEQAIGVTAIKASTDAAKVEADTVGMSAGAAAEYAAKQNALNEAKRRAWN